MEGFRLSKRYFNGLILVFVCFNVQATNGINLIGFGGESIGMAGADIAIARDTTALNTNPAGLYQIENKHFDLYNVVNYAIDLNHSDMFGNQNEKN